MRVYVARLLRKKEIQSYGIYKTIDKAIDKLRTWDNNSWNSFSNELFTHKYSFVSLPSHRLKNSNNYDVYYGEEFLFERLSMKPEQFYKACLKGDVNLAEDSGNFTKYEFSLMKLRTNLNRFYYKSESFIDTVHCDVNDAFYISKFTVDGLIPNRASLYNLWKTHQYLNGEDYNIEKLDLNTEESELVYKKENFAKNDKL